MKQLRSYINIRKKSSIIEATDETIRHIVKAEIDRLGLDADLNHIDVRNVNSMDFLFSWRTNTFLEKKYANLNPDISKWDVSGVNDMDSMFSCCANFNCDISGWDVSGVRNMHYMFWGCEKFNQNLSNWNVSNVRVKGDMFNNCPIKEEFKPKFK